MTDDLSQRFAQIEERLARIENQLSGPAQPALVPPPVIYAAPPRPQRPAKPAEDTEYVIGAKLLPRLGGALVVLGVIFLVAWGFSKGWITKQMVFGAEVAFSLAFVGLGHRYRDSKEQYGQLLTGVGMAGLYLSFVGGYTPYHLYSGNVVVGLTMAVSLALLGLSGTRSWMGLWFLGVLGGLVSSTMPLDRHDLRIALALHFTVLVAAAAIAVRMKKGEMPILLWIGSLGALAPTFFDTLYHPETVLMAALAAGLVCMAAYLLSVDVKVAEAPAFPILLGAALGAAAVRPEKPWYVLGFFAVTAAMSLLPRRPLWKWQIGLGVVGVSAYFPWCYPPMFLTYSLISLAAAFAVISFVVFERSALGASLILLADATVSMFAHWDAAVWQEMAPRTNLFSALVIAGVLVFAAGIHVYRGKVVPTLFTVGMLGVIWFFYHLLIDHVSHGDKFAISVSWGALAAAALVAGLLLKLKDMRYASFSLMGITVVKVLLYDLAELDPGLRVAILLALGILLLIIGYAYVHQKSRPRPV